MFAVVLVGCTEHVRPDSLVRPLAQEVTARGLGIEVPSTLAPGWPTRGPTVWVSGGAIAVSNAERGEPRTVVTLDSERTVMSQLSPVYDATEAALAGWEQQLAHVNLVVDRRVTMATLGEVMDIVARAGAAQIYLAGGFSETEGSAVMLRPVPAGWDPPAALGPIADVRVDLALQWDDVGVRAVARPRPAWRRPFENGLYEPPPGSDERPRFPAEVPLTVGPGDPPLDSPGLVRLAAELCTFNKGERYGLRLDPLPTTTTGELIEVAVAAIPELACRSEVYLAIGGSRREGPAIAVADLRAHLLAAVRASE